MKFMHVMDILASCFLPLFVEQFQHKLYARRQNRLICLEIQPPSIVLVFPDDDRIYILLLFYIENNW